MNTSDMLKSMIAISIAVVIFAMVLLPMIQSAEETQVTVTETADNATATDKYALTSDEVIITLTNDSSVATSVTVGGTASDSLEFITSAFRAVVVADTSVTIYVDANTTVTLDSTKTGTLTITGSAATVDYTDDAETDLSYSLTAIADSKYVLMDDDTNGTYGQYTASTTNVYAYYTDKIVAINNNVAYVGTATTLNTNTSSTGVEATDEIDDDEFDEDVLNLWKVTAGTVIVPIEYSYDTQEDAMDDNMKAIIEVIPILVAVGMLVAAVGMFVSRRY